MSEEGRLGQSAYQAIREHSRVRALKSIKAKRRSGTELVYGSVRLVG